MRKLLEFKDFTKEIKCDVCNDLGYVFDKNDPYYRPETTYEKNGKTYVTREDGPIIQCKCQVTKNVQLRLKSSGLMEEFKNHRFDNFKVENQYQRIMYDKGIQFLDTKNTWIAYSGQYGSGKTHLCDAICGQLVMQGLDFKYVPYVSVIPKLDKDRNNFHTDVKDKADIEIERLMNVKVLYIDDFLKSKKVDLIWEIIDHRYKHNDLITIISTEYFYDELKIIDGAFASRIYQRCEGGNYFIEIGRDAERNYREK